MHYKAFCTPEAREGLLSQTPAPPLRCRSPRLLPAPHTGEECTAWDLGGFHKQPPTWVREGRGGGAFGRLKRNL